MLRRFITRILAGGTILSLALIAAPPANAAMKDSTTDVTIQQTTLRYDVRYAAEYADEVVAGAEVWNAHVNGVHLVQAAPGQRAEILVITDNGWPRAQLGPVRPGRQVVIWFGRQGEAAGYDPVRIAAHELGHSLGLPDRKPGPCSSLMSGSTAGTSCTNPNPDATERAWVERNYSSGLSTPTDEPTEKAVIVDAPEPALISAA